MLSYSGADPGILFGGAQLLLNIKMFLGGQEDQGGIAPVFTPNQRKYFSEKEAKNGNPGNICWFMKHAYMPNIPGRTDNR